MKLSYNPENNMIVGESNDEDLKSVEISEEEWIKLLKAHAGEVGDFVCIDGVVQFQPHVWTTEEIENYYNAVMNERRSIRATLLKAYDTVEFKSVVGSEELTDEIKEWKKRVLDLLPSAFENVPERIKYYANVNDEQIADLGHPHVDFDKNHKEISV